MSSRQLNDWLSGYLEYTEESEPPLSYHVWVGISLMAASLQRRIYLRWGYEVIYPNMYIVLIGPSGKCRKGTAMTIGKDIIKDIGIKITSESITREALIRSMKRAVVNYIEPDTGNIIFHCSLTAISPELSVFLGQNDVKFLADLTDWYDSLDSWTYETKNVGIDEIQGICFNLLGATAPDWLQSILPEEAIGGGFTSRIIFIVEENKSKVVPIYNMTDDDRKLREDLVEENKRKTIPEPKITDRLQHIREALRADLERIATLSGEFVMTDETRALYSAWYQKQDDNTRAGNPAIDDPRFTGYCERRATHIRKLCMIFSASRGDDLLITSADFIRGIDVLTTAEKKMPKVFGGLGNAQYVKVTEKLLIFFKERKRVSRSELLVIFYRDLDMPTLETIEKTLSAMKVIKIKHDIAKGEVYYEWIKD